MIFYFNVYFSDEEIEKKDIVEREIEGIVGEENLVPFGDTWVSEGWYAHECEEYDEIFDRICEEIKEDYEKDGYTSVKVVSLNY